MACHSRLAMQAVQALQNGLKREVRDADAWEALGCAYQSLGRLTAAIKVHLPLLAYRMESLCSNYSCKNLEGKNAAVALASISLKRARPWLTSDTSQEG